LFTFSKSSSNAPFFLENELPKRGAIQGVMGLQGPVGPQGPQGDTGATGPQGAPIIAINLLESLRDILWGLVIAFLFNVVCVS
jgi:hypothetical protein